MKRSRSVLLITVVLSVFFVLTLIPALWFSLHSYEALIGFVVSVLGRPDLRAALENRLFTPQSHQLIYRFHWMIYPAAFGLYFFLLKRRHGLAAALDRGFKEIKDGFAGLKRTLRRLPVTDRYLLGGSILFYLLISVYKMIARDIVYDEAWNYNYFIRTPAFMPFLIFNTYPLYHFIAHFFDFLPFGSTINIRLPAFLSGLFFLVLLYALLSRIFPRMVMRIVYALGYSSYLFVTFTCIGKGLLLSLPFSLLLVLITVRRMEAGHRNGWPAVYFFSGLISILAVPTTFLFCLSNAVVVLANGGGVRRKAAWVFVWLNAGVLLIASLFFLTTLINPSAGENFAGLSAPGLSLLYELPLQGWIFFQQLSQLFFANAWLCAGLSAAGLLMLFRRPRQMSSTVLTVSLYAIGFSLLIAIITRNAMPNRAFTFLFVPCLLLAGQTLLLLYHYLRPARLIPVVNALVCFGLLAMFCINSYSFTHIPPEDKASKEVSDYLLSRNVTSCYVQNGHFFLHYPIIEYYYRAADRNWELHTYETGSTRYRPFRQSDRYDCIVVDKNISPASFPGYQPGYTGVNFRIFLRRPDYR